MASPSNQPARLSAIPSLRCPASVLDQPRTQPQKADLGKQCYGSTALNNGLGNNDAANAKCATGAVARGNRVCSLNKNNVFGRRAKLNNNKTKERHNEMKEVIKKLLGVGEKQFEVPMLEYADLEEVHKHAGDNGMVLKKLNGFLHAHGTFTDGRDLIVSCLQEVSKVPFLAKDTGKKDANGKAIMERDWDKDSDKKYVARVLTATPAVFDQAQKLITSRARGYKYKEGDKEIEVPAIATDIRQRPPSIKGPAKLPNKYLESAEGYIKKNLLGKPKNIQKLNDWLAEKGVGAFTPVGAMDSPESIRALGWLIKAEKESTPAFAGAPV